MELNYIFPRWLVNQKIHSLVYKDFLSGRVFSFGRPKNVVPENSPLFWAARTGALDHVKQLLSKKQASLSDIDRIEGKTALHVSYSLKHAER